MKRLSWADSHPLMAEYYDNEWGRMKDESYLFEMLVLESFQSGLSWLTILKKRDVIERAYDYFNIDQILMHTESDFERIIATPGMLKHRSKIESVRQNACAFKQVQSEFGSFENFLLSFTEGERLITTYSREQDIPVSTDLSAAISKEMKKRGFKYIGPVTIYTYLSAVGIIQDIIEEDDDNDNEISRTER